MQRSPDQVYGTLLVANVQGKGDVDRARGQALERWTERGGVQGSVKDGVNLFPVWRAEREVDVQPDVVSAEEDGDG